MADILRDDPARIAAEREWGLAQRDLYYEKLAAKAARASYPKGLRVKVKKKPKQKKSAPPPASSPRPAVPSEAEERQAFLAALFRSGSPLAPQVRP